MDVRGGGKMGWVGWGGEGWLVGGLDPSQSSLQQLQTIVNTGPVGDNLHCCV